MVERLSIRQGKLWKKYKFRCNYCGNEEYVPLWYLKMRLIFTDRIYRTCSHCHKTSAYVNFFHLNHDSTDSLEKNRNRSVLWDKRIKG